MKLEVGMYVRYISGYHHNASDKPIVQIGKILRVDDYIWLDTFWPAGGVYPKKEFEKFIKDEPSHSIIDLIQVGDYVNGDRIEEIENGELRFHWDYEYSEYISYYENKDIKSIVTKEQFESMSYKVGD